MDLINGFHIIRTPRRITINRDLQNTIIENQSVILIQCRGKADKLYGHHINDIIGRYLV